MLAPGKYYHDTQLRIEVTFSDQNGAGVDPATVVFKTMSPCGTLSTLTYLTDADLGRTAAGEYFADITPDTPGRWTYRWESTGTGTTLRTEGDFLIQDSPFYNFNNFPSWGWWYS